MASQLPIKISPPIGAAIGNSRCPAKPRRARSPANSKSRQSYAAERPPHQATIEQAYAAEESGCVEQQQIGGWFQFDLAGDVGRRGGKRNA